MTQSVNNQNNNLIKNSSQVNPNQNMYKSTTYNRPNNQNQIQNVNQNPKNLQLIDEKIKSPSKQKPQQQKLMIKRFPSGILTNIIKSEKEIANVTQRIQGYLKKKYIIVYYIMLGLKAIKPQLSIKNVIKLKNHWF